MQSSAFNEYYHTDIIKKIKNEEAKKCSVKIDAERRGAILEHDER